MERKIEQGKGGFERVDAFARLARELFFRLLYHWLVLGSRLPVAGTHSITAG